MSDLTKAVNHFKDISQRYTELFNYYDGHQPLMYSTERLREAFQQLNPEFAENICTVVVDTVNDRLEMYGWSTGDDALNEKLTAVWEETGLALDSSEIHETALVCGEAFLIGWQDEGYPLEFYYNDPRQCAVFYDSDRPKVKSFAAKWWDAEDGCHMLLYYSDRLERFIAAGKKMSEIPAENAGAAFRFMQTDPNPYGMIPVFHFRNSMRQIKSDLDNVVKLQDAINKLICDMMVTAEFAAFPARYIISNADIPQMKNAPNQIWDLPAGVEGGQGTQVGTLQAADLVNYSGQIENFVNAVSFITRIPRHYFQQTGANISGEALIAMEAPLVKKVLKKRELFGTVWQEVAVFAARVMGIDIDKKDVQPQWGPAESEQPITETMIIQNYRSAGLPLKSALRLSGYTDAEIAIIEQELADEKKNTEDLASLYLQQARVESARENRI